LFLAVAQPLGASEEKPEEDLFAAELEFLAEEDIVLTAAKHKQKIGFSPSAVIVITRKEIEESGAVSLVELLRHYPAFQLFMITVSNHMVHIRGSYRVLVLVDNREINLEMFPMPFWDFLPIGLHQIERIEVVQGPNSALYGANAVAAVVNIMTRQAGEDLHADLSLAAGMNGTTALDCLLEGGTGPWSFQGTFGIDREHSWMDRREIPRRAIRAGGTVHLDLEDGGLTASGGLQSGSLLQFSDGLGYMPVHDILLPFAQLDFHLGDFKARAYWYGLRANADIDFKLAHPDMGLVLGTIPTIEVTGDTFHTEAQYDLELFEDNLLIGGVDFRHTIYRSDQIVAAPVSESRFGVFLHDEHLFFDRLLVTVGARLDINTRTKLAVSPQIALVYNPAGEQFIRLSGGTAFRKPTLIETSGNFRIDANPAFKTEMEELFEERGIANPDLDNELLSTIELGYLGSFLDKALRVSANAYFASNQKVMFLRTQFYFTPFGQLDMNRTKIGYINDDALENILGFSFSAEGEPIEELTLFARTEYWREYYAWPEGEWRFTEDRLLASAGAVVRLPFNLTVQIAATYTSDFMDFLLDPYSALAPNLYEPVPEHTYLLANLTYRLDLGSSRLLLGLSFFNPFGGRFREKLGVTVWDGSNFGGEVLGPRAMATARLIY
jgi:outer membrane receptor protein involved in Fe transport